MKVNNTSSDVREASVWVGEGLLKGDVSKVNNLFICCSDVRQADVWVGNGFLKKGCEQN